MLLIHRVVDGSSELLVVMNLLYSEFAIELEWIIPFAGLMAILVLGCLLFIRVSSGQPSKHVTTLLWVLPSLPSSLFRLLSVFKGFIILLGAILFYRIACDLCWVLVVLRERLECLLSGLSIKHLQVLVLLTTKR